MIQRRSPHPPRADDPAAPGDTARALIEARRHGRAVPAVAPGDATGAYAAQRQVARALGWFDEGPARHWKSGGASPQAVQTHAALPPDGVFASPADLRHRPARLRWIEAEIALRIGCDIDATRAADIDAATAAQAIDAMCVSIELVDSRWAEGLDAPPLARLADLQSHGALVLGDWTPFAPRDWAAQDCVVRIGVRTVIERRGTHPFADPARVLPGWMRHATGDDAAGSAGPAGSAGSAGSAGGTIARGTIVTTGSWVGMLAAEAGDTVSVSFPGIGEARVRL